ncbi:sensor histidine kinase [Jiella sonneratiae]|uniref:histidine kinase n=1 Tax=Jiella sonneratiae TaxID=2816856 RepID=A0ABS3J4X9_9HYPH|nr:HAMP domain-containing sensor histidine kinase [Jiella sonneratiae]MBO0903998.1 HAMP domain-containing histidine kinase [Jiella sonneratiae]
MSFAAPPTVDHGAARRPGPREGELARTLRAARERLAMRGGTGPRFTRELLVQHAAALRAAAFVLPLPVMATGFGLSVFLGPVPAVLWTLVALGCYLALVATARRFGAEQVAPEAVARWRGLFLTGHAMTGLCWAYLAALDLGPLHGREFGIFQFTVLFVVVASTAMISFTLQAVVPATFALAAVFLAIGIAGGTDPAHIAMTAILIAAIAFFSLVSEILRRSALRGYVHQAEKDELIAELETAKVISDEARRRAEDANLAKSRFLATMSHELRTPLNAILGFSEVMESEMLGPLGSDTYRSYVRDIHASGRHLLGLINEILDLSRIEAGRFSLNEEAIELVAVARECLGVVRIKAEAKGLTVRGDFEPALPALWADERAIRQVILNLLSNAVKFTPRGGTVVVSVGWTAGAGQYVSVRDDGPGIPESEIPVVLSAFGQGSVAMKSAEQGTGLGLPIVQALVKLHNGRFDLHSRLREGTEAIAIFPQSRVLEVMPALDDPNWQEA